MSIGALSGPAICGSLAAIHGRTPGVNSKLHAVCEQAGLPIILTLSAGQVSDQRGVATVLEELPKASDPIAARGCDSAWFWQARHRRIRGTFVGRSVPRGTITAK